MKHPHIIASTSLFPFTTIWLIVVILVVVSLLGLHCLTRSWSSRYKKRYLSTSRSQNRSKPEPTVIDLSRIQPSPGNSNWANVKPIPYRPWHDGPYHVTMGLKSFDLNDWIEIDDTYVSKYQHKKYLYREHRDEVLQVLPGCEEGLFEALNLLKDFLVKRFPAMFRLLNEHTIQNLVTHDVWNLHPQAVTWEKYHPLEIMGLLATEDFFILQTDEQGLTTLQAGGVCFPAGFKIEEKIGLSLREIHGGKVPHYESRLAKSMDRFFANLKVGSGIQRFNFAIDDSDELFHRHSHHNLTAENVHKQPRLDNLHLRVERQTLQRLPKSRALLFSIRTYVTSITEVTKDRQIARALRTSVESFSEDVAKYKNKSLWEGVLQEHLDDILGQTV